ncbi:MAG TPA: CHAT domain-containing protein, partial [Accumulibacter sp.]|uniref:CHAT domain-containing protein n=1 Tax=Accumulibacter sp. TaxID=2053492 RepID=UPI002D065F0B
EAVEELLLELCDPRVVTHADGSRRASARARLVHVPATPGQRAVHSARFTLAAPLGVIEADDLRWYLEDYAVWPSPLLAERAQRIEAQLADWGRLLHDAALPASATAEVLKAWAKIGGARVARRFSVEVDSAVEPEAPPEHVLLAREAGTLLLGLPWELLHDGRSFLFQGGEPVRVRRRLPNEHPAPVAVLATPIRVLLASPRPEDDACDYLDHRASARPLVEAMEALAGQVELRLLTPPTLPALRDELARAARAGEPYHVLHFDGHGVYDRHAGLGALCFEDPEDVRPRGRRRHANVPSPELGALLREYGIALVFLEACQSAQAESANESVASALLKTGVGSVVAMSHSVLVETARRFVEAFYRALSRGERVGSAMLAGQRELKDNPARGRVFGIGEFRLHDWFVPVLYQDRDDPQLFRRTPSRQTLADWRTRLAKRLGELPDPPAHGFVGRSRELLELERLLASERYAVVRGQGGEGKTALASEFARWRVRSRQVQRAAFVSLETHGYAAAVLDEIGRQLLGQGYSVTTFATLADAAEALSRELREQTTLLVLDNLESVLAPPFAFAAGGDPTPGESALAADERERADEILQLAARLLACGETRLIFTSREALPAPFAGERQRLELDRLSRLDALQLVERALGLDAAGMGHAAEAQRGEIESLVDAVHGHARTLALLAPALRERGPAATQAELLALIAAMERRFPGQREHSLLASVELSLRRLPPDLRQRATVLGVFHGAVDLDMLRHMTGWPADEVQALGEALVATGLASSEPYNHLRLNPALCPYLAAQLEPAAHAALSEQWSEAMRQYAEFLDREQPRNSTLAAALTVMELPNLMALLERVADVNASPNATPNAAAGDAAATIDLTTTLHELLQDLNRPRLLARVAQARDAASRALGEAAWGHAQFAAERTRIEQSLAAGRVEAALAAAQRLHARALAAGEAAYADADYDLAMACAVVGRTLQRAGNAGAALSPLAEAQRRFTAVEAREPGCGAAHMATVCITEQADCLRDLGRLDEAAQAYEQAIALAEQAHAERQVAVGKGQLGTVRLLQRRFPEALAA